MSGKVKPEDLTDDDFRKFSRSLLLEMEDLGGADRARCAAAWHARAGKEVDRG